MADETNTKIIYGSVEDIASKSNEPLMHEISTLITATSIVRRRDPSRTHPIV